jgi:hypothetical protein
LIEVSPDGIELKWCFDRHLTAAVVYNHLSTGNFIKDIVDLRHELDVQAEPMMIRGAVHLAPAALEQSHAAIPRDREVALLLRKQGVSRIRPLSGGFGDTHSLQQRFLGDLCYGLNVFLVLIPPLRGATRRYPDSE